VHELTKFRKCGSCYTLADINNQILNCSKCENNFDRKLYKGNPRAKILIINEVATNDTEVNNYFEDLLESSKLTYDDVLIVYAVACITTRMDKDEEVKRLPSNKECTNCKSYINQVIDIMKPEVIICLGASGLNQYIPGSNLFENIETKKEFNGIPTLINFGASDLFKLLDYKNDDEMDKIINSVVDTFDKAADYIKEE
jgi:uracil-DNA glycosylase